MNDVAQQAAALTPEQKEEMTRVKKRVLIATAVYSAVAVIVILGLFMYFTSRSTELFSEYVSSAAGAQNAADLLSRSDAAKNSATVTLAAGLCVYVIGYALIYLVFKKKYPFYSDKLYRFMKNQGML